MNFKNKVALKDVSMKLESGSVIGLIGPNGAGKSTLLKILSTTLLPSSGSVSLNGIDIVQHPNQMRRVLGYLPQQVPSYPQLTAFEYLEYIASLKGLPKKQVTSQIRGLLERFSLNTTGKRRLKDFSGGMLQRVGIIATLLGDPKVIIVDEPTVGLDPIQRVVLRDVLSELAKNRIVVMSTHIISDVEAVSSNLVMLNHGQLAFQGTTDTLLASAAGKVWEYVVPTNQAPKNLTGISSLVQRSDGVHIRMVADTPPSKTAKEVSPNLEDASLAILEGSMKK
ncbi:ATP-binding cassette domain-containing protein [Lentilactobacillus diolivorans]|nr:ATP-binding cassette domain-containing protein [Lentilactobacillus diolivorans]MDH5105495.1 ATP-binding cassette domain-containing protein [Lentilactobacillus diolivorans]